MVHEALESMHFDVQGIYHLEGYQHPKMSEVASHQVSITELERISGLKSPNQVLAVIHQRKNTALNTDTEKLILLLDNLKDPGNLGTIIRTADWFGIDQIVCSPETVEMYNPKVVQASMGAIFRISLCYEDLVKSIRSLQDQSFKVYGAEMHGENAFTTKFPVKSAIVMGSESHGLSEEISELVSSISIPRFGGSESLNVAMATGILTAQYKMQH